MERKNRLQEILKDIGFENFRPSKELLSKLKFTNRRFMKVLRNEGKQELTVAEKENIENWLSEVMNKPVSEITLMESDSPKALLAKHNLS